MKILERRRWFVLSSLAVSIMLMGFLWVGADLPLTLRTCGVFLLATIGLWRGVSSLLALGLIRLGPRLGAVG